MSKIKPEQSSGKQRYIPALGFHFLTPLYDTAITVTGGGKRYLNTLIEQADFNEQDCIIDIACGTGTLAIAIKRQFPGIQVTALDCDEAMLARSVYKANRIPVKIQFDHAYAQHLPYSDSSFDKAVSSLFFHHLTWENKQQVAHEIFRVLKPGGTLHVLDWGPADNLLIRCLFLSVQLIDGFSNTQDNVSGRLVELFDKSGFTKIRQLQSFNTIFGTLVLYAVTKPAIH